MKHVCGLVCVRPNATNVCSSRATTCAVEFCTAPVTDGHSLRVHWHEAGQAPSPQAAQRCSTLATRQCAPRPPPPRQAAGRRGRQQHPRGPRLQYRWCASPACALRVPPDTIPGRQPGCPVILHIAGLKNGTPSGAVEAFLGVCLFVYRYTIIVRDGKPELPRTLEAVRGGVFVVSPKDSP